MEQFDQLFAYMQEDMKADRISRDIKHSPLRQKLEKIRDYVMDHQKAYKQIEEQVAVMADRKDAIRDALKRLHEQLRGYEDRFKTQPPADLDAARELIADVEKCRKDIIHYEQEMRRMHKESADFDAKTRTLLLEASSAKQEFDQLKVVYDQETKEKKAELEKQRAVAAAMVAGIPEAILAQYNAVKKHVVPPIARLNGSQCSGCNTSLPSAVLRKITENGEIIECETCGRMLFK